MNLIAKHLTKHVATHLRAHVGAIPVTTPTLRLIRVVPDGTIAIHPARRRCIAAGKLTRSPSESYTITTEPLDAA
jgi:hypothetical protein